MESVFFIYVWRLGNGQLAMIEIEGMSFHRMKEFYDYHFPVVGRSATVHCFFSDYEITDREMKRMATSLIKGEYVKYSVELYDGKLTKERGVPKETHPRY